MGRASRRPAFLVSPTGILIDQGLFFSGAALVTFGGAYAVLAYVAQQAVAVYGWLAPGEMVRGLALAETTPGPLIMVVQFVAFVGAFRDPGTLDPWAAAVIASLLVTWVTFVPCFLFVLLGAPYVERLRHNHQLTSALNGITAAVVGVIANLAVYFALHTLFGETNQVGSGIVRLEIPVLDTLQAAEVAVSLFAAGLIFGRVGACCAPWAFVPSRGRPCGCSVLPRLSLRLTRDRAGLVLADSREDGTGFLVIPDHGRASRGILPQARIGHHAPFGVLPWSSHRPDESGHVEGADICTDPQRVGGCGIHLEITPWQDHRLP